MDRKPPVDATVPALIERKSMEAALRESEQRSRELADSITDPFFALDENLRCTYWNKACERLTGLSAAQVVGGAAEEVFPKMATRSVAGELFREVLRSRQPRTFVTNRGITSKDLIFEVRVYPFGRGISVFARDITESRRTNEALRQSEERFRAIYEHAALGMKMVDTNGCLVMVNPWLCRLLGYSEDELLSKTWRELTHPDDIPSESELMAALLGGTRSSYQCEKRYVHRNGFAMWVHLTASALKDKMGRPLRLIGIVQDITARKQAEQAFVQLSGRMINAEEEERKWVARELHDGAGQALAMLSVELQKTGALASLPEVRDRVEKLYDKVGEVSRDLQQIAHRLHPSTLDHLGLSLAIKEHCEMLSAHHQDLEITFTSKEVGRSVPKDVALCLFRIVQEALGNVVTHSGASQARVELVGHPLGISLSVDDNGHGFDVEAVEAKGRLGLISMRERLRIIGGSISIRSDAASGTHVEVHVPAGVSR